MKKIFLLIFLCWSFNAHATQIVYGTTYAPSGQLTSTNLNGNFQNASQVVNGKLDNTNADTTNGYRFYQTVSVLPASGNQGAVYFLTTDDTLNFDTGGGFNKSVSLNSPINGGILYYNSGWTQASIGANNTVLTSNGTIPSFSTTIGTSANNIVQLDGSAKLPAVDGGQLTGLGLGSWSSKSVTTVYQAATDLFLAVTTTGGAGDNYVNCITDSSATPSTIRTSGYSIGSPPTGCSTMVKKNDYYEVTKSGTNTPVITIIPIGS